MCGLTYDELSGLVLQVATTPKDFTGLAKDFLMSARWATRDALRSDGRLTQTMVDHTLRIASYDLATTLVDQHPQIRQPLRHASLPSRASSSESESIAVIAEYFKSLKEAGVEFGDIIREFSRLRSVFDEQARGFAEQIVLGTDDSAELSDQVCIAQRKLRDAISCHA